MNKGDTVLCKEYDAEKSRYIGQPWVAIILKVDYRPDATGNYKPYQVQTPSGELVWLGPEEASKIGSAK